MAVLITKVESTIEVFDRNSQLFHKIISELRRRGISQDIRRRIYDYATRNEYMTKTDQMEKSEVFFDQHIGEFEYCKELLADDISKEIYELAIKFRITHNLQDRPPFNMLNQYFPEDVIQLKKDEIFIDCGAFLGETVTDLIRRTNGYYKRIVCFEPDDISFNKLKQNLKGENIVCFNAGVWNCNTNLFMDSKGLSSSKIEAINNQCGGGGQCKVYAIDSLSECADASFIKMDIEGAELNALIGAEKTIRRNRPTLAICIYHSDEDYVSILKWINNLNIGYKFYVRHHNCSIYDTVLYAVCR